MAAALYQRREPRRLAGETHQRVGVEHDCPLLGGPRQRRSDQLAQGRTHARARAERDRAAPLVGEQGLELPGVRERRDHHRGQVRGVDGDRVGRARHSDDAGARAQRRAGREPGGAGAMPGARQNENRAARIFVARCVRARQRFAPDGRRIDEGLRRDGGKRGFGNANIGEPDRAAQRTPGQQADDRASGERRSRSRSPRPPTPRTLPVSPSMPEGTSTASTRPPARAKPLTRSMIAFASPSMSRASPAPNSASIDAVGAREVNRRSVEGRPGIARGGERRIAFQRVAPAEQSDLDRISAESEQPRGDEAVAAVAAGAAEDGDPAARLREPRRLVGDRETRPLHERNAGRSGRNRKAIGLAHFSGRQQFRERQGIAHGGEGARRSRAAQAAKTRFPSRGILLYPADADPR